MTIDPSVYGGAEQITDEMAGWLEGASANSLTLAGIDALSRQNLDRVHDIAAFATYRARVVGDGEACIDYSDPYSLVASALNVHVRSHLRES